jgi:mannosyltransferase OCH1-like enzyme
MGATVLSAYDKLIPGAFKADFFRYVILYLYGGCYFDSGLIYLEHLRDTIRHGDTFVSSPDGDRWFMNNAFICCTPQHPIIDITIRRIVRRVANNELGEDMLDITGPVIMARAFMEYFDNKIPIRPMTYSNGVRLLKQELAPTECRLYKVFDLDMDTIITINKYPKYIEDMSIYSGKASYSDLYNRGELYQKDIVVQTDGNYSTEPNHYKSGCADLVCAPS